tara:strand:- start:575 stop:1228 length:654 start_codon:yes stop_codon:yes gene_type:complete
MKFSYIEGVKERAHELAEVVKTKSGGNAILLPVTKGFGVREVEAVLEVGLTKVGESYAQELLEKAKNITDNRIDWHMIGRIQRNKVKKLSETVDLWHSVDRKELIAEISKYKKGSKILIQVDMNERYQQGGCSPENVPGLIEFASDKGVNVEGLMTIGVDQDVETTRNIFAELAKLSKKMGLKEISMGMSNDFEIAIDYGATILRVGRSIFGERAKK